MHALYVTVVFLHVVAAMTWVGGLVFFVAALGPTLRAAGEQGARLVVVVARRFRVVGWSAIGTLVVTGVGAAWLRGYGASAWLTGAIFEGPWGERLAHKLTLVALMIAVSFTHDFVIGPRAARLAQQAPTSPERARLRKVAGWLGRLTFALALGVVAFAVQLVR